MIQQDSNPVSRATIVGPGLLGSSIGMALKDNAIAKEVWVYLRNQKKKEDCTKSNWCDHAVLELKAAVENSDLIILCTPVDIIIEQLAEISKWIKPHCLVTDIGSLKNEICRAADEIDVNNSGNFVGSHPMAGSENSGMEFGNPGILKGKNCIVTPTLKSKNENTKKIELIWEKLEMSVSKMSPLKHDEVVSWISHLPHAISTILMCSLSRIEKNWLSLSGNGLRDTTRIAAGNPEMWKKILHGNKENLISGIDEIEKQLNILKETLKVNDEDKLLEILKNAKNLRDILYDN